MMYDFTDGGVLLRKYISVNLGWWHNLKNASEKLWQRFSLSVFAPLFHSLYPASRFPIKSRGPQDALIHFLYLAGAYRQRIPGTKETVRNKLKKLLLRAEEAHSPIDKQGVYHLYNLKFLLEYAIPSVALRSLYRNTLLLSPFFVVVKNLILEGVHDEQCLN
jgi:hypothetical protein